MARAKGSVNWRAVVADTRPLQDANFRRMWIAQIVTMIGAQLTVVSVPAQLYADTGSSAYVGLAGLFGLVPLVIFGLYGGALVDHFDRRRVLIVTTVGLIGTSGLFLAQAAAGNRNPWLLLGLFSVQQAFFAVNSPARSAILPTLLSTDLLPAANALGMTVFQFGAIVGPLVAGILIPFTGFTWLYLIDTITLGATLYSVLRLPPLPVLNAAAKAPGLSAVWEGFAYLRTQPVLLMSFMVDLIAMVFGMPRALYPQIAHQAFHGPAAGGLALALLFAAIPAGAVLGGVFSGWLSRVERQGYVVLWCIGIWGVSMAAFGVTVWLAPHGLTLFLWLGVLCQVVGGAADMASASMRQAMLLEAADDNVRGRLQGVFVVVVAGGPRIADVAHGGAAVAIGTAAAAAGGGVLVVIGIVACAILVPTFVRYRVTRAAVA